MAAVRDDDDEGVAAALTVVVATALSLLSVVVFLITSFTSSIVPVCLGGAGTIFALPGVGTLDHFHTPFDLT